MVVKTSIKCPHCLEDSGHYLEDIMFLVLLHDLLCKSCGKVVITANRILFE